MNRVLVVIEGGVIKSVVAPEGTEVWVLDADGLATGGGLQCGLQETSEIHEVLNDMRERVGAISEEEDDYDADSDIEILDDLANRFKAFPVDKRL
jgi:hypothetical protein